MILTVNVTAKHIAEGSPCSGRSCPVALALIEAGYPRAEVSSLHIDLDYDGPGACIPLPESAKKFVRNFDGRITHDKPVGPVTPFSFQIQVP